MARQNNLQTFDGNLGGAATPVVDSGDDVKPFSVKGDTFVNLSAALARSCDQQFNACANQANGGADFEVSDCQAQKGKSESRTISLVLLRELPLTRLDIAEECSAAAAKK